MKEITIYMAYDGKLFVDKLDCEWYELIKEFPQLSELEFFDNSGVKLENRYEDYNQFDLVVCTADIVIIPTESALVALLATNSFIGLPCAMQECVNSKGTWRFRVVKNENGCYDHEEYIKV